MDRNTDRLFIFKRFTSWYANSDETISNFLIPTTYFTEWTPSMSWRSLKSDPNFCIILFTKPLGYLVILSWYVLWPSSMIFPSSLPIRILRNEICNKTTCLFWSWHRLFEHLTQKWLSNPSFYFSPNRLPLSLQFAWASHGCLELATIGCLDDPTFHLPTNFKQCFKLYC